MASGRRPVWLEEQAHLLIKQYAKLTKTSMTETTSQLVLNHLATLEGGSAPAEVAASAAEPKAAAPAKAAPAPAKATPEKKAPAAKPAAKRPATKRRESTPTAGKDRASSDNQDGVRYLGGIWLV